MTGFPINPCGSLLAGFIIVTAIVLSFARTARCAESLNLFYTVEKEVSRFGTAPAVPRTHAKQRSSFLDVDQNGDVVIRHDNVSLVLAYNTPDDGQAPQDRSRDLQPRECAAPNGFNFKVRFPF